MLQGKKIDFGKMMIDLQTKIIRQIHNLCMKVVGDIIIFSDTSSSIHIKDEDGEGEYNIIEVCALDGGDVIIMYDCDSAHITTNAKELSLEVLKKLYEDCYDELCFTKDHQ